MNIVALIGNLTADPELRYTTGKVAVCDFSVAVNRKWKTDSGETREEVDYFDVVAWNRTAEVCGEFLAKGRRVAVEGRLSQEKWEDPKTGQKRSRVRVVADRVHFIGTPKATEAVKTSEGVTS